MNSQLELPFERPEIPDRNAATGGRSFYFFDFDDNVMFLPTPLFVFHRQTGEQKQMSTREFASISGEIGQPGLWADYELRQCTQTGSFRRFRHKKMSLLARLLGRKQPLIEDLSITLERPDFEWKGPSWTFFWHAVHNGRPLSIITARGHHPETIREGIRLLVTKGHLTREPNYLSIFPVSNLDIRKELGDMDFAWHTAKLKQFAIKKSLETAFKQYGENPSHRFGMSDDDPVNLALIIEAMIDLKKKYPQNSFFVINTHNGRLVKQEILINGIENKEELSEAQLRLF